MNTQQIKNLANRICIKDNCSGFLRESVDAHKNEILRCNKCHNFINLADVDMILINYEVDSLEEQDVDSNLKELNNL